ncbi:MAG: NnrS family protein, partial [Betaproteobacteria bacterium]|nr:NnrS family protein [Betaproteobacteria bacterium]
PRPARGWPPAVLALGFRPFYLLAGVFAAVSVPLWMAQLTGQFGAAVVVNGPQWHAHEMLFGYTLAVIVGFLFTAVRNWTQQPTPTGAALALLTALWLAGRILALTPWSAWTAATDTVFILGAALGIARPLAASRNRRNYFFVALILGLGAANLAFHAALQGLAPYSASRALVIALDVVLLVMAVMAGRVVPMFINNALPGAGARRIPALERTALATVLLLLAADLAGQAAIAAAVAAAAALAHGARLALWRRFRRVATPCCGFCPPPMRGSLFTSRCARLPARGGSRRGLRHTRSR